MTSIRSVRVAVPAALLSLSLAATPAMALQPSVEVVDLDPVWTGHTTDLAHRGSVVALTMDTNVGDLYMVRTYWSTDDGASGTWHESLQGSPVAPIVESAASVCAGRAVAAYVERWDAGGGVVRTNAVDVTSSGVIKKGWNPPTASARRPDVACVANTELAVAWFEKITGGYKVVLETGVPAGSDTSAQRFSLGTGSPGRGLSVAATSDRVYVAWFLGSTLKLRRYRIGTTSARTLTALGTTTIGTIRGGTTPKLGADGSKVVLAYTHGADLKLRRSTNKGASFGSARTIRNLPDASEVGALATTVTMKGNLVALGIIDVGGIETLTGTGRGYKSIDGGSTFTRVTTHTGGRVLATVVKVGSNYRWAEAWDHSLEGDESPGMVRFRRE